MADTDATPTVAELIQQVTKLKVRPRAFQALWDGDSKGWGLHLQIVHRSRLAYRSTTLVFLRFGGDIRLFNGQVPPWPESAVGAELGEALARHYGVPFFFPSPGEPDDGCPNWWEQDEAIRCEDCQKLIIPRDRPYLPKEVCSHCHMRRRADDEVRRDAPSSPNGVTLLCGSGDDYHQLNYSSEAERMPIAAFALRELGRDAEARDTGVIILEGADLGLLEAHLDAQAKALVEGFEPLKIFPEFPRPEAMREITYGGRTLELDLKLDREAWEIYRLISALDSVKRAAREHLTLKLVFRRGMTRRGDRVIRALEQHGAVATVQQLAEGCGGVLDEDAVRAVVRRLEELGYVRCSGDEVRLTETGRYM